MKRIALLALALVASATIASAKDTSPPGNLDASYLLLQQKLRDGAVPHGSGVAVDLRDPNGGPPPGWFYIDALYCGWLVKDGAESFYATNGKTTYWDVTNSHMLATAMAISCVQGTRLYVHIYTQGLFDETKSTTYH